MKISQKIKQIARYFDNPQNDLLVSAEDDEIKLGLVANAMAEINGILEKCASEIDEIEKSEDNTIENLNEIVAMADFFDKSEDPDLMKYASVLDELLMTIAAPKYASDDVKMRDESRIEEIKKRYKDIKEKHDEYNFVADALEGLEKSKYLKEKRPLEAPIDTRYCPDHPGMQVERVGHREVRCPLDGKTYNYEVGFETLKGNKIPGTSVQNQSATILPIEKMVFDTRESKTR